MNKEVYEALKRIMAHATQGGPNDKAFWDDIRLVEDWIEEYEKEVE